MKPKFRAWDSLDEVMLTDITFDYVKYPVSSFTEFELMQYTGLKDMEGNEIYIGDILLWSNDVIILIKAKDELGFYEETIKSFDENVVCHDIRFYRSEDEAIILGNIFENPRMKNKTNWTKTKIKKLVEK